MGDAELRNVGCYKSNSGHWHLFGKVYGNSKFQDGKEVATSRIKNYSNEGTFFFFETENSFYAVDKYEINKELFDRTIFVEVEEI